MMEPELGPRIKLADFGFSTSTVQLADCELEPAGLSVAIGTRYFMAPEIIRGGE